MLLYPHNRFSITFAAFFCVEARAQKQGFRSRGSKAVVQKQWFIWYWFCTWAFY